MSLTRVAPVGVPTCGAPADSVCGQVRRLDTAALVCVFAWTTLAILSHTQPRVPVAFYGVAMATAWIATVFAWRRASHVPRSYLVRRIWLGAVVFRLIGAAANPIFEDDYYRFLWDGWVFATTGNPFGVAPADYFTRTDVPDVMLSVLDGINHPDVPTIYGPVAQWGFRLSHAVAPGALWPWKLVLLAAELLTLHLLLLLAPLPGALLYAWCPLLIQETAFNAHPEALGVGFLVLAVVCLHRDRPVPAAVAFALAAGVKPLGGLLAPLLLVGKGGRPWLALGATTVVLWGPFLTRRAFAEWAGLATFAREWEFNSSIFGVLSAAAGTDAARVVCALLMIAGYAALLRAATRRADQTDASTTWQIYGWWAYGGLFLLAPVVNPWYLAWLLPFVACRPSTLGVAMLATVSLSYLHGMNLGIESLGLYGHPVWLRPLEYGLLVAVALPAVHRWLSHQTPSPSAVATAR